MTSNSWYDESEMLKHRRWWVESMATCPDCGGNDVTAIDYTTDTVNVQCDRCLILFPYEVE